MDLHCVATMIHIPLMTTTDCRACEPKRQLSARIGTDNETLRDYLSCELQVEGRQVVRRQQNHHYEHVAEVRRPPALG